MPSVCTVEPAMPHQTIPIDETSFASVMPDPSVTLPRHEPDAAAACPVIRSESGVPCPVPPVPSAAGKLMQVMKPRHQVCLCPLSLPQSMQAASPHVATAQVTDVTGPCLVDVHAMSSQVATGHVAVVPNCPEGTRKSNTQTIRESACTSARSIDDHPAADMNKTDAGAPTGHRESATGLTPAEPLCTAASADASEHPPRLPDPVHSASVTVSMPSVCTVEPAMPHQTIPIDETSFASVMPDPSVTLPRHEPDAAATCPVIRSESGVPCPVPPCPLQQGTLMQVMKPRHHICPCPLSLPQSMQPHPHMLQPHTSQMSPVRALLMSMPCPHRSLLVTSLSYPIVRKVPGSPTRRPSESQHAPRPEALMIIQLQT